MKLKVGNEIKSTVCKPYLTPMIMDYLDFEDTLANIYVRHETDDDKQALFVLVNESNIEAKNIRVSSKLMTLNNFLEEIESPKNYRLFKLAVPDGYLSSYKTILEGKFSRLSNAYKKQIFKANFLLLDGEPNKQSKLYKILYRHPDLRKALEAELSVKIDEDAELRDKPDLDGLEKFKMIDFI